METIEQVENYFRNTLKCSVTDLIGKTLNILGFDHKMVPAVFLGVGEDGYGDICAFVREKDSVEVYGVHVSRVNLPD